MEIARKKILYQCDQLENDLKGVIEKSVTDILEVKFKSYDDLLNKFNNFSDFGSLLDHLQSVASKKELEDVKAGKVSTDDWHDTIRKIQLMYDKVKHLAVVQTDLVTWILPKKVRNLIKFSDFQDKSEHSEVIQNLERVRQNSYIVTQWITNTNEFGDDEQ